MRKSSLLAPVTFAVVVALGANYASAVLTVFTNRASWQAAAGGAGILETYAVAQNFVPGDNFYNGVNYRFPGTVGLNNISGGNYNGDEFTTTSLDIVFPAPVTGFGADFVGAFTSQGLNFTINGETASLNAALGAPGTGFFGIVASAPFTLVDVTSPQPPNEIYDMDNLEYVIFPEPASLGVAALSALMLCRRRHA